MTEKYLSLQSSYIILYQDFFDICPDSKSGGIVLSYFYGWHRTNTMRKEERVAENRAAVKEGMEPPHDDNFTESPWVYLEETQICDGLFRLISERTFRPAIQYLIDQGFIRARRN